MAQDLSLCQHLLRFLDKLEMTMWWHQQLKPTYTKKRLKVSVFFNYNFVEIDFSL